MFKITGGRGFHITFENGYTVSVQFGPGSYSDNHDEPFSDIGETTKCCERGSTTAECAVWVDSPEKGSNMIAHKSFDGGTVSNRSTPAEVLELLNWAAKQTTNNQRKG